MANVLDFQVNGLNPSTVGGTGTAVKYFQRILGTNGPGSGPNTNISSTNAAGALFLPAFGVYNGQQLVVLASGNFGSDSGDPSGTVTIQLYAVTGSASSPTYTSIATTGAMTPTYAGAQAWGLEVNLLGDTGSGHLVGAYQAYKDGSVTAPTTLTTTVTGLDFNKGNSALQQGAVLGFVVGATFGTSDASNKASMYQFQIES